MKRSIANRVSWHTLWLIIYGFLLMMILSRFLALE
jgi:hypothetical protein